MKKSRKVMSEATCIILILAGCLLLTQAVLARRAVPT